ncbi:sensor histidine kinase, partial [Chloroflexota bacterium]
QGTLGLFHDFYGIDLYGMLFFAPVVYTAYVLGIKWAIVTALIATLLVIPYAVLIDLYPNALFKPTAFAIILSAVGAVVAMLQKGDEQRRRNVRELKCLYDVGKVAEDSQSVEGFLSSVTELIPQAMPHPDGTKVRIMLRDKVFRSPDFEEFPSKIAEELAVGGEVLGSMELYSLRNGAYLKEQNHLAQTLAERIGGAVREIELEQSLRGYYEQLEEMVEKRTRDLEEVQEKLIRSERLAAVGELASGVGHELRNPLNVIRNCVYLLHMTLSEGASEEELNTLKLLDRQIDISNRIVTDLLDFTRIKPPSQTRVALNGLLKESLSWVTVPEDTVVTAELEGDSLQVKTDTEQVGRAFANIIANAIQAMNGKGELKINTGIEGEQARVTFADNGCGIPEENLEKIFEPLFTTKAKGIGLGLAITRRLVEQNHGTVEVVSQPEKGTTFTVRLPFQKRSSIKKEN